jgi:photosystem II stability/assembly factor-like uncharacterized protein
MCGTRTLVAILSALPVLAGSAPVLAVESLTWSEQQCSITRTLWTVHFVDTLHGWAAGNYGAMVRTTDGGQNWSTVSFGLSDTILALAFASPDKGWAAGNSGVIHQSSDSGLTWSIVYSNAVDFLAAAHVIDEQTVFFAGQEGFDGVVLRTTDGGADWGTAAVSGSSAFGSLCFVSESVGWVAGRDDIAKTVNGGASWSAATTPANDSYKSYIGTIWFVDTLRGFGAGRYGGLSRTDDGGANWVFFDSSLSSWIEDIHFPDPRRGVMAGERGLVRWTQDSGNTWTASHPRHPSSLEAPWFRSVFFVDSAHGWMVGDSGIIMKGAFVEEVTASRSRQSRAARPAVHAVVLRDNTVEIVALDPAVAIVEIALYNACGRRLYRSADSRGQAVRIRQGSTDALFALVILSSGVKGCFPLVPVR